MKFAQLIEYKINIILEKCTIRGEETSPQKIKI